MQAGPTGEPGKAPACISTMHSAATMRPSLVAPILTLMLPPGAGPEARNTSSRAMVIFTGLPDFWLSRMAKGSR